MELEDYVSGYLLQLAHHGEEIGLGGNGSRCGQSGWNDCWVYGGR
jgi:hypothetical protein